jgi:signal transduction histidine kinase
MNNVARHANASSLRVVLDGTPSRVHLAITDDGYGFGSGDASTGGMGMDIMAERASEIGADLVVSSEQDIGTRIEVTWTSEAMGELT